VQGRIEHKIKTEEIIKKKISRYPSLVSDYYLSMANYTHSTKLTYINKISNFFDFLFSRNECTNEVIKSVQGRDINAYVNMLQNKMSRGVEISKVTIALSITALRDFYDYLLQQGEISENPLDRAVKRPSCKKNDGIVYLEKEEIKKVYENLEKGVGTKKAKSFQKRWKNRDTLLIVLPLVTGMRVSALDEINIEDIDFEKNEIRVIEKREKLRTFTLSNEVMELIRVWMVEREEILKGRQLNALFISDNRGVCSRLTVRSINRIVQKYSEGIDKHITPHKLRSTFGTQFYRQTGDIYLTSNMMGHESTKTTSRYVAVDNKRKDEENKSFMKDMLQIRN